MVKGFIYGTVLGLFFGVAIFLLGTSVALIAPLPATPAVLASILFSASVMAGVGKEYAEWLDKQAGGGTILFNVVKGFIYGTVLGLFFGIATFLLGSSVALIAPLPAAPTVLASVIFSASVMAGVGKEYTDWLDKQ